MAMDLAARYPLLMHRRHLAAAAIGFLALACGDVLSSLPVIPSRRNPVPTRSTLREPRSPKTESTTAQNRGAAPAPLGTTPLDWQAWEGERRLRGTGPWRVGKGRLELPVADPLLRMLLRREAAPPSCRIETRLAPPARRGVGRAGLVFRGDDQGAYVFRLCRNPGRVQLMWHRRRPFSWWELADLAAPELAGLPREHRLAVELVGDRIVCRLDGRTVVDLEDGRGRGTRIGVYACDGPATFTEFRTTSSLPTETIPPPVAMEDATGGAKARTDTAGEAKARTDTAGVGVMVTTSSPRFWIHDDFEGPEPAVPWWNLLPAGSFVRTRGRLVHRRPPGPSVALMDEPLTDATLAVRLRLPGEGEAGLVFRWRKDTGYLCVLDRVARRLELRERRGREQRLLARGRIVDPLPDRWLRLQVEVVDETVVVALEGKPVMRWTGCTRQEGRAGAVAARGVALLDDFLLSTHPEGRR